MAKSSDLRKLLDKSLKDAELAVAKGDAKKYEDELGSRLFNQIRELGQKDHAARGVALTLFAYKALNPGQDVRSHMTSHPGGFNARGVDTEVTIPFLAANSLPRRVESHWMTRVFANAGPFRARRRVNTSPAAAGALLAKTVPQVNDLDVAAARAATVTLLMEMIRERDKNRVELARPKLLTIEQIVWLLERHMARRYEKSAPRLPQLAIYAIYQCLVPAVDRYRDCELAKLLPMKAADRKAKTVGDVVVLENEVPFEGVEVKHGEPIATIHLTEAIAKLESAEVRRYFILSTAGIAADDEAEIERLRNDFRRTNGCEIVTNGVLESVAYYLRLLDDPVEFVNRYTALVQEDRDLAYEHRLAWNEVCADLQDRPSKSAG